MSAPVATARGTPAGRKLDDGHSTKVTFARSTTVSLWEKAVSPAGADGGDAIDTTTMHNDGYRTFAPRQLITLMPMTFKAAYDPNVYNTIISTLINEKDTITVRFSDGSTLAFFGYLQKFEPDEVTEGEQPTATVTIVPTNWDHVGFVEAGPVLTSVSGT